MCLCVVLIRILLFAYFATALLQFACSDCGLSAAIYAFAYDGRDTFSLSESELFQFLEDYKFPVSYLLHVSVFLISLCFHQEMFTVSMIFISEDNS
jgi:hypothetical protein